MHIAWIGVNYATEVINSHFQILCLKAILTKDKIWTSRQKPYYIYRDCTSLKAINKWKSMSVWSIIHVKDVCLEVQCSCGTLCRWWTYQRLNWSPTYKNLLIRIGSRHILGYVLWNWWEPWAPIIHRWLFSHSQFCVNLCQKSLLSSYVFLINVLILDLWSRFVVLFDIWFMLPNLEITWPD